MQPRELLEFLHLIEPLKTNTRHSVTAAGVPESVAAHCWRLATLALLLEGELPQVDINKVIQMCLIHDFGEAVTGDIPSFLKTGDNQLQEQLAVFKLISLLPDPQHERLYRLLDEMDAQVTPEARVWNALDKMEAVLQHNEAPLSSWLPLERELQQTYGAAEAEPFPFLAALRTELLRDTQEKLKAEKDGTTL
ncbi:MAG: HD domain-containing protein [Clostridiaceae bacterium]|nr:HD domain-containing protein [Clostridiaceae bacterium]